MGIDFSGLDHTRKCRRDPRWGRHISLPLRHPARLSLNYANGRALLELLGLPQDDHGEVSIPVARRAIMRARTTFERRAPTLTREPSEGYGPARAVDGAIVRGVHFYGGGLDVDDLRDRLERFACIVEVMSLRGATAIAWA